LPLLDYHIVATYRSFKMQKPLTRFIRAYKLSVGCL